MAEQHASRAHDGVAARELRRVQARDAGAHGREGRSGDAFHGEFLGRLRGDYDLQPRGCDQDKGDEREGEGRLGQFAGEDIQEGGSALGVQGVGAELYTLGPAYDRYFPVFRAA